MAVKFLGNCEICGKDIESLIGSGGQPDRSAIVGRIKGIPYVYGTYGSVEFDLCSGYVVDPDLRDRLKKSLKKNKPPIYICDDCIAKSRDANIIKCFDYYLSEEEFKKIDKEKLYLI